MVPIAELDNGEKVVVNKATVGVKGQDLYVQASDKSYGSLLSAEVTRISRRWWESRASLRRDFTPVKSVRFSGKVEVHRTPIAV
ncbi:MAG: hypothetical protein UT26_C0021G0011 [Microgenomates group bacterium GW2011_GWC1_39_12]|nr:MAG: hypothetical protein UT26_C0021G0011 [Microgenomates group bacterium GW2011_GWC1_39_12]